MSFGILISPCLYPITTVAWKGNRDSGNWNLYDPIKVDNFKGLSLFLASAPPLDKIGTCPISEMETNTYLGTESF